MTDVNQLPDRVLEQALAARRLQRACNETTEHTVHKIAGDLGPIIHAMMHGSGDPAMLLAELAGRAMALADGLTSRAASDAPELPDQDGGEV